MLSKHFKFTSLFLAILLTALSAGVTQAQTLEEETQKVLKKDVTLVDDGMLTVVIAEEEYQQIRHMLDYLLQNARDNAAEGNFDQAARELDLAASYMHLDVKSGTDDVKEDVVRVAENLETIAAATDHSKTPVDVYDNAIFSAHHALANYHYKRANTYMAADFEKSAGYALEAALVHYRSAALTRARMQDMPLEKMIDEELLNGVETFALAMREGQAVHESDASALINRLGMAISEMASTS